MERYSRCWLMVTLTIGAVGMLGVLLATPIWGIIAIIIFAGGISWFSWVRWLGSRPRPARPSHRAGAVAGVIGALTALALMGLNLFLGPASVLIGLCLTAASPPVLRQLTTSARRALPWINREQPATEVKPAGPETFTPGPTTADQDVWGSSAIPPAYLPPAYLPPASSLGTLSDAELCSAWRTSFITLQRHHTDADLERRAQLIHLRQHYLDELERRNPAGFHRWLYTGARPASDPSRYIARSPIGPRTHPAPPRATQ